MQKSHVRFIFLKMWYILFSCNYLFQSQYVCVNLPNKYRIKYRIKKCKSFNLFIEMPSAFSLKWFVCPCTLGFPTLQHCKGVYSVFLLPLGGGLFWGIKAGHVRPAWVGWIGFNWALWVVWSYFSLRSPLASGLHVGWRPVALICVCMNYSPASGFPCVLIAL